MTSNKLAHRKAFWKAASAKTQLVNPANEPSPGEQAVAES
jgi:hypothetical protein